MKLAECRYSKWREVLDTHLNILMYASKLKEIILIYKCITGQIRGQLDVVDVQFLSIEV